jgi:hypothetical protein
VDGTAIRHHNPFWLLARNHLQRLNPETIRSRAYQKGIAHNQQSSPGHTNPARVSGRCEEVGQVIQSLADEAPRAFCHPAHQAKGRGHHLATSFCYVLKAPYLGDYIIFKI